jgi:hypothetical protein
MVIIVGNDAILHAEVPLKVVDFNEFLENLESPILGYDTKNSCIWGRDRLEYFELYEKFGNHVPTIKNINRIFVGHSVVNNVQCLGNVVYCDTGSVFKDGKLSLVNIKTLETFSK